MGEVTGTFAVNDPVKSTDQAKTDVPTSGTVSSDDWKKTEEERKARENDWKKSEEERKAKEKAKADADKKHADDPLQKRPAELQDKTGAPPTATGADADRSAAEDQDKRTKRAEVLSDENKGLSHKDRLEAFVVRLRAQAKHNAPITPAIVQEVEAILADQQGKGKAPVTVYNHTLPRPVVSRKDDGTVVSMITAEDGLNYIKDNVKRDAVSKTYWDKTEELLKASIEDPTPFKLEVASASLRDSMANDRNRKSPDALAADKVANPLTGFNHPGGVPNNAYGADDV